MLWLILCQLDWPWGVQIKNYFLVCLWGCFCIRLVFISTNSAKLICPPQCVWASSNPARTWIEKRGKEEFISTTTIFFLPQCLNWDILSHLLFTLNLEGICTFYSPGSQVFGHRLDYITGFPGSLIPHNKSIYIHQLYCYLPIDCQGSI